MRDAAVDLLCLAVFVFAGRQSHDLDSGLSWYLTVLWPIVVGWFVVAMVAGLYTARSRGRRRLTATVVLGTALGLVLRAALTHRSTPVAFVIVAFAFITLTTVGWRIVAGTAPRLLARRGGSGGAQGGNETR